MVGVVLQKKMSSYEQTKTCSKCGFTERRQIDKYIAAFESTREWTSPCTQCKSTSFKSSSGTIPLPDTDLLKIWSESNDLMFLDQDEDILLAEADNFNLLSRFVQDVSFKPSKREILLSAICVLLYDNTPEVSSETEECDLAIAEKVRKFLISNKSLFDELDTNYIDDYIKKVVYPQIGIKF
jgi:predicted nucleic-acid-binding Zn-ribbon protein